MLLIKACLSSFKTSCFPSSNNWMEQSRFVILLTIRHLKNTSQSPQDLIHLMDSSTQYIKRQKHECIKHHLLECQNFKHESHSLWKNIKKVLIQNSLTQRSLYSDWQLNYWKCCMSTTFWQTFDLVLTSIEVTPGWIYVFNLFMKFLGQSVYIYIYRQWYRSLIFNVMI